MRDGRFVVCAIRTLEHIQGMRLGEFGPPAAAIEYDGI